MRGSVAGLVVAAFVALLVVVVLVLGGARGGASRPESSGELGALGGGDGGGTVGDGSNQVLTGPDRDVPCVQPAGATPVCATPLPILTEEDLATDVPLRLAALT